MMYNLTIAEIRYSFYINEMIITPDETAQEFYVSDHENERITETFHIKIVPFIPQIGGELVFDTEICEVRRIGRLELRAYRDPTSKSIYGLYIDDQNANTQVWVVESWFNQVKDSVYLFNVFALEKTLTLANRLVFHSCYIEYRDKGILFSGFSGIGKSTQGDLWKINRDACVINGDRSVIGRINSEIFAWGFPFSGTSGICRNVKHTIAAIIFLEQDVNNCIRKLTFEDAFKKIWEQVTVNQWSSECVDYAILTIQEIVSSVPVYELSCTPDERAVECLENRLLLDGVL